MKPNPFASLNHFTVPIAIRCTSFSVLATVLGARPLSLQRPHTSNVPASRSPRQTISRPRERLSPSAPRSGILGGLRRLVGVASRLLRSGRAGAADPIGVGPFATEIVRNRPDQTAHRFRDAAAHCRTANVFGVRRAGLDGPIRLRDASSDERVLVQDGVQDVLRFVPGNRLGLPELLRNSGERGSLVALRAKRVGAGALEARFEANRPLARRRFGPRAFP